MKKVLTERSIGLGMILHLVGRHEPFAPRDSRRERLPVLLGVLLASLLLIPVLGVAGSAWVVALLAGLALLLI